MLKKISNTAAIFYFVTSLRINLIFVALLQLVNHMVIVTFVSVIKKGDN